MRVKTPTSIDTCGLSCVARPDTAMHSLSQPCIVTCSTPLCSASEDMACAHVQVFCVLLWCIDSYLYYSLFTLGMLVVFECTVVMQRQRSLNDLRAIQVPKPHVEVRFQSVPTLQLPSCCTRSG